MTETVKTTSQATLSLRSFDLAIVVLVLIGVVLALVLGQGP